MPIILFILNPAISLIYALFMNIKKNNKIFYLFVIAFSLYFGYSITPKDTSFDCYQIIQIFKGWNGLFSSYSNFLSEWSHFNNPFAKDLFEGTIFFLVYSFTNEYHFIFLFCALFFSVFKLKAFSFFLRDYKHNRLHTLLVIFFFVSIPLFQVTGFRFFPASWVAIFATLKIFVDKDLKYIFLLALTPLIHITFLFYLAMIAIAYIAVRRINESIVVYLFIVSVIIGMLMGTLPKLGYMGDGIIGNLLEAYINDDYKSEIDGAVEQSNYIKFFEPIKYLYYNIIALLLYLYNKKSKERTLILGLLMLLSITNSVRYIPSMSRFFTVLIPFILILLNKEIAKGNRLSYLVYLLPFVEMFYLYQLFFTLYPKVLPNDFLFNVFLT